MVRRIVLAIVVGVVVTLVCYLLGMLLTSINISWVDSIGAFFKAFGGLIGLLAAIWHFFTVDHTRTII